MSRHPASQHAFRCQMVRAVVAVPMADLVIAADEPALRNLARSLADWEQSRAMLRAKGYGDIGTSLLEVVNAIPMKVKA